MMRGLHVPLALAACLIAVLLWAFPGRAELVMCQPLSRLEAALALYGERRIGHGVSAGGQVVALYASARGSWTLVTIQAAPGPDPRACPAAAGEGWERVAPADRKKGLEG